VTTVRLLSPDGRREVVPGREMAFAYDRSRLQQTREIVVWAEFAVTPGDTDALRARARESLAFRKRTQPLALASAGCIFQNPDAAAPMPVGIPPSAGALVDRAGLKGLALGGARISPTHANFVVNDGTASARDVRRLIDHARAAVLDRFGVQLEYEVVIIGDWSDAAPLPR
jgi:UDP-N-acetylmuramate dehydrogenase